MVFKWLDRGWVERRLKAWSVQWSGGLPHFSFPNPFSTGVEGRGKWFLFGRLGCLFSEPVNSAPLLCHWHDYWGYGCHFSLCDSSRAIIVNTYSSPLHQPRDTHVSFTPAPPSLCLLGDVKMILRPGKRFMFRTQISLGKLSLPGQFSCLAKHLKGSIRKKNYPQLCIECTWQWVGTIYLPRRNASSQVAGY